MSAAQRVLRFEFNLPVVPVLFYLSASPSRGDSTSMELRMQHDLQLRAAARVIYDACYPSEEWAPVGFDEAERFRTTHYRQAVGAAQQARSLLADRSPQPSLFQERAHA
jgi:hypothetical protein